MTESEAVVEAAEYAERYRRVLFDRALEGLDLRRSRLLDADPAAGLTALLALYCFGRPGESRASVRRGVASVLRADGDRARDPDELGRELADELESADLAASAAATRATVADAARLVDRRGNPFRWVGEEARERGRLTTPAEELAAVRGVGTDAARAFLRDAVWVADAEACVRRPDAHRLQPMTAGVRAVAEALWPSLEGADREVLAERAADACADRGVSNVAFSQGAQYAAREFDDVERAVRRLRAGSGRSAPAGGGDRDEHLRNV